MANMRCSYKFDRTGIRVVGWKCFAEGLEGEGKTLDEARNNLRKRIRAHKKGES